MLLSAQALQQAMTCVQAAFPAFTDWEYTNDPDEHTLGEHTIWGRLVLDPEEIMPRCFYITFATYQDHWTGYLTIGQHAYMWTSADFGDAYLLQTTACPTLEAALVALQAEIARLFRALSVA